MIKSIHIANVASYSPTPQTFGDLKEVNFVYGSNGCGKTTISRIIASPENYGNCQILWESGLPQMSMVYNRDFVERNFKPSQDIKGVFTLGTDDDDIIRQIETKKQTIEEVNSKITSLNDDLTGPTGKTTQLATAAKELSDYCWNTIKATFDTVFPDIFIGVNNNKSKLVQRVLEHFPTDDSPTRTQEELEAEAKIVFDANSTKVNRIPDIDFSKVIDSLRAPIFGQAIIGSGDVDISGLISELGISDWVRQGWTYLGKSQGKCPFCQQPIPKNLEEQFRKYFDKSFDKNMETLTGCAAKSKGELSDLLNSMDSLKNESNPFLDKSLLSTVRRQIESKIEVIQTRLDQKCMEPSRIISLPDFSEDAAVVTQLVSEANKKSDEHNKLLDDRKNSKDRLIAEIWSYIIKWANANLSPLISAKQNLEKAKSGLETNISNKTREMERLTQELHVLEKQRTSVLPTIEAINRMLDAFGFNSFKLVSASETSYALQRPNGEKVRETLSEGERSFVTFRYFYHLLKGGETADSVNSGRIAVFDDPVSSLDADVLFIVSSLVRRCIDDLRNGLGNIKQVVVLTHNVYFHKEVTFNPNRKNGSLKDETFWIVKKINGESSLSKKADNPIKTSYELLWDEIKDQNTSLTSIQNTMRRILEYYYRILGGWRDWNLDSWFEGQELLVCQSLLSWVNDGSHFPDDDLHYRVSSESIDVYKTVFKRIFEKTHHIEHYNMMMQRDCCVNQQIAT